MKTNITFLIVALLFLLTTTAYAQDDEFAEFDDNTTEQATSLGTDSDEFAGENNDNKADEFASDEFSDGETSSSDEFASEESEFDEFTEGDVTLEKPPISYRRAWWAFAILLYTILAGILVRFHPTRKLHAVFLLITMVVLGFYRGGPGIISSFQNTYLYLVGYVDNWQAIILFIGLLPITYFFGKVFCGWACYLGAIQEFLYIGKIKIFQTEKAQKVMRIMRYVILGILILQLTISENILWSKIGPFKAAINLFSPNITGYILLGVLLFSSLFIHRPFCKAVCPAGLVFGWITKIPGASVLGIDNNCAGCKTCSTSCNINAITRDNKISKLDNQECIMCGDCMSDCNIKTIKTRRYGKEHQGKIVLKGIKNINTK